MGCKWFSGYAVLLVVVTGLVVVSGTAAVGSLTVSGQHSATHSKSDVKAPGLGLRSGATNTPSTTSNKGWTMGGANAANTNSINTTGPTNPITVRWTFATDANTFSAGPLVTNDTVYFGTRHYREQEGEPDGTLYAVDAWTGEVRWTFTELGDSFPTNIAVLRDTVYVGSQEGKKVYALDAATGDEYWSFRTTRVGPLRVANRTLYVVGKGRMYALGALRGEEKWTFSTPPGGGHPSGLAVKDGTAYTSTRRGHVFALDAQSGAIQWDTDVNKTSKKGVGGVIVANDHVYVTNTIHHPVGPPSYLYALDSETGEHRWNYSDTDGHDWGTAAVFGEIIYLKAKRTPDNRFEDRYSSLHALNSTTGAERWSSRSLSGNLVFVPDRGYIRKGGADGALYTMDPETGAHHARFTPPPFNNSWDKWRSGMAVLNGSLYTGVGIDTAKTSLRSDHTTFYALGTPEFNFTELLIRPQSPAVNETMTATVTVRNTGTGPGTFNATLVVNGNVTNATTARLEPRTNKTITFTNTFQQNGTYTVAIANLTRTITVGDVDPATTPTAPPQEDTVSPTQTVPTEETATASGSETTPTATSGTAPGFGVGVSIVAVAVVFGVIGRRLWT